MQKIIVTTIAMMALLLFGIGLFKAFQAYCEGKAAAFNTSFWTYIVTSVNGLLIINLTSLLGLQLYEKDPITLRQWVAFVYLLMLLGIFLFWAFNDFDSDGKIPTILVEISKSFFALLLAALGMILKENPLTKKTST